MITCILEDDTNRIRLFKRQYPFGIFFTEANTIIAFLDTVKNDDLSNSDKFRLFLDHDLDGETYVDSNLSNTGMEVVRYLEKNKLDFIQEIICHSHNAEAGLAMTNRLESAGYNVKRIMFFDLAENWP